jgi:taurine dioxygenase
VSKLVSMSTSSRVEPLAAAIGAEVFGVDLGVGLSADDARELRDLLRRHGVLVFRGQPLDDDQQIAVGAAFGSCIAIPMRTWPGVPRSWR